MPAPPKASHLWLHYLAALTLAVTLLTGGLRLLLLDWSDRNHCHKLLNKGRWLDSAFRSWQPEGCMLAPSTPATLRPCLQNRRVLFVGDSTVRQLFFAFAHLADPALPASHPEDGGKHTDFTLVSGSLSLSIEFLWDPYLNSSKAHGVLATTPRGQPPALVVLGSGLWYLRNPQSGGLPAWEKMVDRTFALLAQSPGGAGIADEIVFLPVEEPVHAKLNPERQRTIHMQDVQAMNSDLVHRVAGAGAGGWRAGQGGQHSEQQHAPPPVLVPSVLNDMLDASQTEDGLHFSPAMLAAQVNVLLNHRCNRELRQKYPWDRTCCRPYPFPGVVQLLVIVCVAGWGLFARLWVSKLENRPALKAFFPSGENMTHAAVFGLAILLCFLADRTPLWDKEHKQFDPWQFGALLGVFLVAGVVTVKRADKDLGFLNRDQTDEWKGWMQIVILVYHYYGGSQISGIYNPVRVLVASYLFMTGYGHFTYYYRKADFSFARIAQVLVRLNLLTIALAYAMDTDYLFYYFAPLVSFWFLVIYFTMLAGAKYNDRLAFLLPKMALAAGLVALLTYDQSLLDAAFSLLARVFRLPWDAREWRFRTRLDLWIVWLGALTALLVLKSNQLRLADHRLWPAVKRTSLVCSALTLAWFLWFELSRESKFVYNASHPYVAGLPILAFALLRNGTPVLRSGSSRLFTFVGRCSLETFILQYHVWLAGDTKGILLVLPRTAGARGRALNLVLSTGVFVWVSWKVAAATGALTAWVCKAESRGLPVHRAGAAQVPAAEAGAAGVESIPMTSGPGVKESLSDVPLLAQATPESGPGPAYPGASGGAGGGAGASTAPDPPNGAAAGVSAFLAPVVRGWKEDVRIRLLGILVGLWMVNLVWPG